MPASFEPFAQDMRECFSYRATGLGRSMSFAESAMHENQRYVK